MLHALIHDAKEVGTRRAEERNEQGAYDREEFEGPVFACRLMERGVAPKTRREDSSAQTARGYELLAWHTSRDGEDAIELTASMELEVIAPPVTPPEGWKLVVDGDPERMNDGVTMIGWLANVVRAEDAA